MRTATTIARKASGWVLLAGPDVPADQQRHAYHNLGTNWPKDALEVRFQQNDGPAKTIDRTRALTIVEQMKSVEAKVKEKEAIRLRMAEESKAKSEAESTAKAKAAAAQRAAEVKAKEDAKKAAANIKLPAIKTDSK